MKVQVEAGNFGLLDGGGHQLVGFDCLDGIAMDKLTFGAGLTVGLEDIDVVDVVSGAEDGLALDGLDGVDHKGGKEGRVSVDEFAGHGCFGTVEECLITQTLDGDSQFILDEPAGLSGCDFESHDDVSRVHFHFDEFVGPFEQLSGENDD